MNLKKINIQRIVQKIENENFILVENTKTKNEEKDERKILFKNKKDEEAYITIVKKGSQYYLNAHTDSEDADFLKNITSAIKATSVAIKRMERKAIIENLFFEDIKPNEESIVKYLEGLEKDSENKKYAVRGDKSIKALLKLKEQGHIKDLYSSNQNEVVVSFKKTDETSRIFENKMTLMGMKLKKYTPPKSVLSLEDFLKIGNEKREH